jgi:hypothetical protein
MNKVCTGVLAPTGDDANDDGDTEIEDAAGADATMAASSRAKLSCLLSFTTLPGLKKTFRLPH